MAIAAAVCGLLLWTLAHWRPDGGAPLSDTPGLLFPRGLGEVDSLIVEQGAFRMDLRREDGRWRQVEPFATEVDQVAVRRTLDALSDLTVLERITLDQLRRRELQLKDFGLSTAQMRVIVRTASRRIELCFGNRTPDGREVYFYLDAATQVLVAPCAVLDAVPVSIESVRDRALLRDTGRSATALELRRADMPYIKLEHVGGEWQLVQPYAAAADSDMIERILSGLRQTRIEAFIWPSGANTNEALSSGNLRLRLALYGLDDDNAVQVQFWETGGPAGVRLRFGKPVEGHPGWIYAQPVDEQIVVAVTNAVLPSLLVTPSALCDRRLFRETPAEIARVQLRFADQLVECRRDEKQRWTLVSPQQDAADQEQVGRLLVGLLRLRAQQVFDPHAGATPEFVLPPNPVCVVELATAARTRRFAVAPDETPGLMDIVFTNSATRFVVAGSNLPSAVLSPAGAYGLRDRVVLAVATSAVRRVSVRRDTETETVERMPDSELWQVSGNSSGKAVTDALNAWLTLMSSLPAARIERLGVSARDLENYGLAEPAMEIDLDLLSTEALRKVLLIGRSAADGGRYALLRGHDAVFVLAPETMRVIERRLVQP